MLWYWCYIWVLILGHSTFSSACIYLCIVLWDFDLAAHGAQCAFQRCSTLHNESPTWWGPMGWLLCQPSLLLPHLATSMWLFPWNRISNRKTYCWRMEQKLFFILIARRMQLKSNLTCWFRWGGESSYFLIKRKEKRFKGTTGWKVCVCVCGCVCFNCFTKCFLCLTSSPAPKCVHAI